MAPFFVHQSNQNYNRNPCSSASNPSLQNRPSSWSNKSATQTQNNPTHNSQTNVFCYFCSIPGHVTKDCRKLRRFLRDHQVSTHDSYSYPVVNNTSSHTTVLNTPWMWDTGASNHTNNNNNNQMHVLSEYGGPDEIVLGDGKT